MGCFSIITILKVSFVLVYIRINKSICIKCCFIGNCYSCIFCRCIKRHLKAVLCCFVKSISIICTICINNLKVICVKCKTIIQCIYNLIIETAFFKLYYYFVLNCVTNLSIISCKISYLCWTFCYCLIKWRNIILFSYSCRRSCCINCNSCSKSCINHIVAIVKTWNCNRLSWIRSIFYSFISSHTSTGYIFKN